MHEEHSPVGVIFHQGGMTGAKTVDKGKITKEARVELASGQPVYRFSA